MKTNLCLLMLLATCALLAGCGSLREPTADILLTGAGGAIGYEASGKKIGGAAIGAGAGYLASKIANSQMDDALTEAEKRGYDRALNQAVKQQYWIIQNQQRRDETSGDTDARYVTVTLPETVTADGTVLKPTTTTLRTK